MESVITSKFQTTIPKDVRENLKLSIKDTLEWKVENGKVVVSPVHKKFFKHKNSVKIGSGDNKKDIRLSRERRSERYQ